MLNCWKVDILFVLFLQDTVVRDAPCEVGATPRQFLLLVTPQYNNHCYDPNILYTSFGRNKNQQPSDGAQPGGGWGGGCDWGKEGQKNGPLGCSPSVRLSDNKSLTNTSFSRFHGLSQIYQYLCIFCRFIQQPTSELMLRLRPTGKSAAWDQSLHISHFILQFLWVWWNTTPEVWQWHTHLPTNKDRHYLSVFDIYLLGNMMP